MRAGTIAACLAISLMLAGCAGGMFGGYGVASLASGPDGVLGGDQVSDVLKLRTSIMKTTADANPATRNPNHFVDAQCFNVSAEQGTNGQSVAGCRQQRNEAVATFLIASEDMCQAHMRSIYGREAAFNLTTGSVALLASAWATTTTGATATALAAVSTFAQGTRALGNEVVYKNIIVPAVVKKIRDGRDQMAAALFPASRASATIDEYPMMAALRDVVKFHYTCSFMYGLEKALEEGMQTTVESKRVKLEQDKLNLELYVANKTNTLKAQGVTAAADLAADPGIKGANSRIAVIEEQLLSLLRVGAPTVNTPMVTASTVVLSADKKTSVTVPADITLTAVPTMLSGTTAANVEFFQGDKSINVATGTSGQFSHKVTGLAAGVYTFTARVTDTTGVKSAASAPVLLVVQSTNVTLVSEPTAPQPGNTITFTVTDNSKPPASGKVEFFHGRDKIGEVVAPGNVYRYTPDKNLSGINDFHARITDSAGQTSTSNLLSLAIGASAPAAAPAAPSVTLSGPTAAVAGDAKFTLKVTSSAAGRSISRIEFFKDGQRISAAGNASDTLDYLPPTKPAANSTSDFIAQVTYTDKVSVVSNKVTVTFK